jgi:hypothetical protein
VLAPDLARWTSPRNNTRVNAARNRRSDRNRARPAGVNRYSRPAPSRVLLSIPACSNRRSTS